MIWSATVMGQPPSLNDLYEIQMRFARGGRTYKAIGRTEAAKTYHDDAVRQLSAARESGWAPEGQVRVIIDLFLVHDIDADNCLKVLLDALEAATGVNDSKYLPCVRSKTIGVEPHRARVQLWIEDIES